MVHLVDVAVQPGNSKDENPHTDYGYSAAVMENYWKVLRSQNNVISTDKNRKRVLLVL